MFKKFASIENQNKDIYDCKKCNLKIDRDLNGARNILLKHIIKI
jgi:transposase